jgi:hypothetical protein
MSICICRYPIMITDKRFGDSNIYMSMPLEILGGMAELPLPDMEIVDEIGFDNIKHKYMKVKWQDVIPSGAKRYNVNEHIVIAGCQEDQLSCDSKSIFAVSHPIEEWNENHMIELKENTVKK